MSFGIILKYVVLLFMLLAIIACSLCIILLIFGKDLYGKDLFATSSWVYNPKLAIECRSCGCIYKPSLDGKRNLAPRYCPYCGKKMSNWKDIRI